MRIESSSNNRGRGDQGDRALELTNVLSATSVPVDSETQQTTAAADLSPRRMALNRAVTESIAVKVDAVTSNPEVFIAR